jgi:hypothetical protein
MSKDDLETQCMNELFGTSEKMIVKIYVKSQEDVTSMLVTSRGNVYFQDVLDVPEITGIQRCVSFIKHQLDADITEIYPDKLNPDEVLKDVYINYSKINHCIGENPNEKALTQCSNNLSAHLRWNFTRGGRE